MGKIQFYLRHWSIVIVYSQEGETKDKAYINLVSLEC